MVAVGDALKRERAVARGADPPAPAGLPGVDDDAYVIALDPTAWVAGDIATPSAGEPPFVGSLREGNERQYANAYGDREGNQPSNPDQHGQHGLYRPTASARGLAGRF